MPSATLTEWMAFERRRPFLVETIEYGFASLQMFIGNTLAQIFGDKNSSDPPFELADFLPIHATSEEEAEEIIHMRKQTKLSKKIGGIFDAMGIHAVTKEDK